jgi:RNA polymerase sigma-70 factor (ECF subfamily)
MATQLPFEELVRRLRIGDAEAARALWDDYGPAVRRCVRIRMTDPRLRSVLDSVDVCQSVFGSFFVRAAHGEYDLKGPEDLQNLLVRITRNKVADWARKETAGRRDRRKQVEIGSGLYDLADGTKGPQTRVAEAEIIKAVRSRLGPDELELVDLRTRDGLEWDAIAQKLGGKATNLRKKLSRALRRAAKELGLEGDDGG